MKSNTARDQKCTPNRQWYGGDIRHIRHERAAFMGVSDSHDIMAIQQSTTDTRVTVDLAAVGASVPAGTTVDVEIVPRGLEVERRNERFILERDGDGYALTGVVGRDELPASVPDWLSAVARERFEIDEVTLGR